MKSRIHGLCTEALNKRIDSLKATLTDTQSSANNETKSSAGDKHETGRAMIQLETEKLNSQLVQAMDDKQRLMQLRPDQVNHVVSEGALVHTDRMVLYFSVAAGTFEVDGMTVITLSLASGLGIAGRGKGAGESFTFRDQTHQIREVY